METGNFKEKIIEMYKKLGFEYDDSKFGHIKSIGKVLKTDFVEKISYIFPSASGNYKGRIIRIAPSYTPYEITDTYIGSGNIDTPSVIIKSGINQGSYNYMVVSLEMNIDIGVPSILIYPKTFLNQVGTWLNFTRTSNIDYKKFNNKYFISLKGQEWFSKCLDEEIMDSMAGLGLSSVRGAIFQFSKNYGTFAILPGAIKAEKIEKIIEIIWQLINKIERAKSKNLTR